MNRMMITRKRHHPLLKPEESSKRFSNPLLVFQKAKQQQQQQSSITIAPSPSNTSSSPSTSPSQPTQPSKITITPAQTPTTSTPTSPPQQPQAPVPPPPATTRPTITLPTSASRTNSTTITATPSKDQNPRLRKSHSTGTLTSNSFRVWAYWWSFFAWAPVLWKLGLPKPRKDESGNMVFLPRMSSLESDNAVARRGVFTPSVAGKTRKGEGEAGLSRTQSLPIISVRQNTDLTYGRYRATLGIKRSDTDSTTVEDSNALLRPTDASVMRWQSGSRRRYRSKSNDRSNSPHESIPTTPPLLAAAVESPPSRVVNAKPYSFGRYTEEEAPKKERKLGLFAWKRKDGEEARLLEEHENQNGWGRSDDERRGGETSSDEDRLQRHASIGSHRSRRSEDGRGRRRGKPLSDFDEIELEDRHRRRSGASLLPSHLHSSPSSTSSSSTLPSMNHHEDRRGRSLTARTLPPPSSEEWKSDARGAIVMVDRKSSTERRSMSRDGSVKRTRSVVRVVSAAPSVAAENYSEDTVFAPARRSSEARRGISVQPVVAAPVKKDYAWDEKELSSMASVPKSADRSKSGDG
ncbi:hypothetical protein BC829DRAFT_215099 [Chytridium lagenaria]|nr:hypothetical protein BC829DRAFT_215099 [Chytridium lagenaria]